MSRTKIVLKCNDRQRTSELINQILDSKRYDFVQKNNEEYWKQGLGVTESPKYIKYYFDEDNIILEGWVNNFGKESDLNGFVGALPKSSCKKVLNEVRDAVENLNNQTVINNGSTQYSANKNGNIDNNSNNQTVSSDDSEQLNGRAMINASSSPEDITASTTNSNNQTSVVNSANNNIPSNNPTDASGVSYLNSLNSNQNKSTSKGIIPRKYRGSLWANIFEIFLALFYIYGASTGYLVLRFTDSSEALIVVALIILIHGVLSLISNLADN